MVKKGYNLLMYIVQPSYVELHNSRNVEYYAVFSNTIYVTIKLL